MTTTTLVLGSTGKTGRRVAERLVRRGIPIRAASRSGAYAFDWEDRRTWPAVLHGVAAAYVSYFPDLGVPGADATVRAFAELAVQSGVRRLVLLSGRGEEGAELAEPGVQESGAEWTILRSTWFNQNFSEGGSQAWWTAGRWRCPSVVSASHSSMSTTSRTQRWPRSPTRVMLAHSMS